MKNYRFNSSHPLLREGYVDAARETPLTLPWMVRHVRKAARLLVRQPGKVFAYALRHPKKFFFDSRRVLPLRTVTGPQRLGAEASSVLADLETALNGGKIRQRQKFCRARDLPDAAKATHHDPKRTRIIIDLQCCQGGSVLRGIGRYALELTKAIARNANSGHEIWVVVNDRVPNTILPLRDQLRGHIPQERIRVISLPLPVDVSVEKNVQHLELTRQIYCHAVAGLEPDVLLVCSMFEGWGNEIAAMFGALPARISRAVIAYDLIPYLKQEMYLARHTVREWYFRQMDEFKQAHKYLAISECTRQDLIKHLQFKPETIVNISAGISDMFRKTRVSEPGKRAILARFGITKPFLLYTGNFDPHKNIYRAIDAYSRLDRDIRENHQFVIICPPAGVVETKQRLVQDYSLNPNEIVLTGRLTDDELIQLYNLGKAFILPSLYEGFGFPPLEAMSCGMPTIASNTSSLPEVIGCEEALFDPLSVDSIRDKLHRVLTDGTFRDALTAHALTQSKKFSWDITARRVLDFIVPKAPRSPSRDADRKGAKIYESLMEGLAATVRKICPLEDDEVGLLAKSIALNDGSTRRPQILYEVSEFAKCDAKTGIQRVTRNILCNLIKITAGIYEVRPVVFRDGGFYYADKFAAAYSGADASQAKDLPIETVHGSIYLAVDLYADGGADYLQELHRLRMRNIPCYFVIHDLIPIRFPRFCDVGMSKVFGPWLERVTSIASGLIGNSAATQNDLILWMDENQVGHRPDLHISHFHLGADIHNDINGRLEAAAGSAVLPVDLQHRPTFLVVSTIEPRKGHEQVLEAFDLLWGEGGEFNLIFVGKKGWCVDTLIVRMKAHPESGRKFHWLTHVSDAELNHLYQACDALIFASYAEGFGLAIVEAAQHGVPLILRDLPVFREVAGESAFYFHADEPAELADAVKAWLELSNNGHAPSSKGVSCLTWEESTRMLLSSIGIACVPAHPSAGINPADTQW
jgi:glycosyltransferase involved in cell wall biosynthesis